jgi:MFS family permease
MYKKDLQYYRFCSYGFLKNLRFYEPFLILILKEEGLSYTAIASLYAIREISRNIMEIPAGVFADLFGRRRSMIIAFSSYIISFILFFLAGSFAAYIPAFLFFAVGDAFRTGTHKAMIFTYLQLKSWEKHKVDYYGHTRSWSQIGSAISAISAGTLLFLTREYKLIFLFTTLPYLLDLINLATYPANLEGVEKRRKGQMSDAIRRILKDFAMSFSKKELRNTVLSISSYTGYYKAVKDFIQPVIQAFAIGIPLLAIQSEEKRTAILVGLIYFAIYLLSSLAARNSGRFVRIFRSPVKALLWSVFIGSAMGIVSGSALILNQEFLAIIFFTGIYLIENLRKPIGIGSIADNLKPGILASVLSAESQAETLFATVFVLLLGFLVDKLGLGIGILSVSALAFILYYIFSRKISYKN